ncbi:MAG: efflux RND transporter permease subunit, partial [Candidatus Hydrogenedentes bacterium]|nr:efflux RND transporter permease subunit [Candidatus Hydrogenedentota bacterium]
VQMPIGLELGLISNQAASVAASINGFIVNLVEALLIVIGVLMVAMGLRSGILIGVILLLTILATFIFMKMWGIMLERISLGALIIALGMLVDNAIVIVDGILVGMQRGENRIDAAKKIVGQTMWPLFGATVVAVLAFAAIGVSQDSTGEYCRSLFQVMLISLMASWVMAITVTPLLGVMFLKVKSVTGDSQGPKDSYGGLMYRVYKKLLLGCLRFRWVTMAVMAGMLALAVYGFGFVDRTFFPDAPRPQFMIHCWMPQGTHINKTAATLKTIEEHVRTIDGVTDVSAFSGGGALRFLLTYSPEDHNDAYGLLLVNIEDFEKMGEVVAPLQKHLKDNYP